MLIIIQSEQSSLDYDNSVCSTSHSLQHKSQSEASDSRNILQCKQEDIDIKNNWFAEPELYMSDNNEYLQLPNGGKIAVWNIDSNLYMHCDICTIKMLLAEHAKPNIGYLNTLTWIYGFSFFDVAI